MQFNLRSRVFPGLPEPECGEVNCSHIDAQVPLNGMQDCHWVRYCDGSLQSLGQFVKTAELSAGLNHCFSTSGPENAAFEPFRFRNDVEERVQRCRSRGISTSEAQHPSNALRKHMIDLPMRW